MPLRRPSGWSRTRSRAAAMCSGRVPQQPPMICAPSARQCDAISANSVAVDGPVEAPAVGRVVAEVRIDAERQVGEVAQPREHPGHVVGRQAVDEQRPDPDLLEAVRRRGRTRRPRARPSAGRTRRTTPWRQRRKLTQTGIPLCTSASTAPNVSPSRTSVIVSSRTRSGGSSSKTRGSSSSISRARLAVDVAVDAEGERRVAGAAGLLDRLARRRAAPRRAMSIQCTGVENAAPRAAVELAGQAPRVRRDHVAAGVEVGAVHVADRVGLVDERPACPTAPRPRAGVASGRGGRARWRCRRRGSRSAAGEQLLERPYAVPRCPRLRAGHRTLLSVLRCAGMVASIMGQATRPTPPERRGLASSDGRGQGRERAPSPSPWRNDSRR